MSDLPAKLTQNPLLSRDNKRPDTLHHIHLLGISGTGMASLAGMLKSLGYHVTGSDENVYPPMSTFLRAMDISLFEGYDPAHLTPAPDLVVVGNVIRSENPEARALGRLGLPYLSFPQALGQFALVGKQTVVVSGTHGKTTTASMAAWVLETAGMDPGFMIGGIPCNFERNFKLGTGPWVVLEGDEYDTAFFDKGPKFLHYRPRVVILTSIEYDHADIYEDLDHVIRSFRKLIALVPEDGLIIANADDPVIRGEVTQAHCPVARYSVADPAQPGDIWHAVQDGVQDGLTRISISRGAERDLKVHTPLYGRHNVANLLATVVMARFLHVPDRRIIEALRTFQGVRRRQDVVGEKNGIVILDDFAHHPTAVRETIQAVRGRYPGRLIAVFEPRSNSSRRNIFQDRYAASFDAADLVMIPTPPMMDGIPVEERFSSERLVQDLREQGIDALYFDRTDALLNTLINGARSGDVVLFMSNGGFDRLPQRLLAGLTDGGKGE